MKIFKKQIGKNTDLWSSVRFQKPALLAVVALLAVGGYFFVSLGRATNTSYAVPAGIASDCSKNVTAELTNFIASVPNGTEASPSTVNFKEGGCYLVTTAVKLERRNDLVLAGNNATIRRDVAPPVGSDRYTKAILYIGFSRGITVRDLKLVGDNRNQDNKDPGNYYDFNVHREHEHALFVYGGDQPGGSENILISNYSTDSVFGDAVRLWGVRNARVEKSHIYGAGRQGVGARGSDRLAIVDNRFDYLRRTAVDFEEDPVTNVRIQRNYFESQKFNLANFPGSHGPDFNILLADNTAGSNNRKTVRCTEETGGIIIRNNQPAFTTQGALGGNSNGCPSAGFNESQLPPLENPFPNGSAGSGGTNPCTAGDTDCDGTPNTSIDKEKDKKIKECKAKNDKHKKDKHKKDKQCEDKEKVKHNKKNN